jgi:MATE family multidrug resistance protein
MSGINRLLSDAGRMMRLAGPVIVARMGIMTMAMVDTVVIGHYSTADLARVSMAFPPISIVLVAGIGMLGGTAVMAARFKGNAQDHLIGAVWHRALAYGLIIALLAVPIGLQARTVLAALGQPPDLIDGAAPIMLILALGLPFHLLYTASAMVMEGLSRPLPGMILMLIANVLNLALNLILVPGFSLGIVEMPALGGLGTALATTGSRLFLAVALGLYVWRLEDWRAMGIRRFSSSPDPSAPRAGHEQMQLGLANGASLSVEQIAFAGMSVMAGWIGAEALAGYSVAINLMAFVFMISLGLGVAASVMVSEAWGQRDLINVRRLGYLGLFINLLLMGGAGGVMILVPGILAHGLVDDPALVQVAAPLIALAGLAMIFDGTQTVAAQILRGRGETWIPTVSHFFSYVGLMVPLAYVVAFTWGQGVTGLMTAIILASVCSSGLLVVRFMYLARMDRRLA